MIFNLLCLPIQKGEPLQRFLDQEEKDILFKELSIKDKMSKKDVLKLLFDNPQKLDLNYKEVEGNRLMAAPLQSLSGHHQSYRQW